MGAASANVSGERLVNFDANVVGPVAGTPIGYNRATNSCSLTCHNYTHNLTGSANSRSKPAPTIRGRK